MCGFVTLTLVLFSLVESDLEIISLFLTGNKASETKQSRKKEIKRKLTNQHARNVEKNTPQGTGVFQLDRLEAMAASFGSISNMIVNYTKF